MRNWVSTLATGVAGAALLASGAIAQDENASAPQNASQPQDAPETVSEDASFDEAFPQMVSEPLVQGDLEAPGPIEAYWTVEQVEITRNASLGLYRAEIRLRAVTFPTS